MWFLPESCQQQPLKKNVLAFWYLSRITLKEVFNYFFRKPLFLLINLGASGLSVLLSSEVMKFFPLCYYCYFLRTMSLMPYSLIFPSYASYIVHFIVLVYSFPWNTEKTLNGTCNSLCNISLYSDRIYNFLFIYYLLQILNKLAHQRNVDYVHSSITIVF